MLPANYLLVFFLLTPLYHGSYELKSGHNYAKLNRKQTCAFMEGNNSVLDPNEKTNKTFEEAVRKLNLDESSELSAAVHEVDDRLHMAAIYSSNHSALLHGPSEKYRREKRRQREYRSSSHCGLTLILEQCQEAGEEVEPGYISACETCQGVYAVSNNCFPRYVNAIGCGKSEIGCAFDIEDHPLGRCSDSHLQLYFLKSEDGKYGESSLTEMLEVQSGCQCALNKHSTFLNGIRGGGWRPRHRGGRPNGGRPGHYGGRPGRPRPRIWIHRSDNETGHEKGEGLPRVLHTAPLNNNITTLFAKTLNTWQRDSSTSATPGRKQLQTPKSAAINERQRSPSKNATSNKMQGYPSSKAATHKTPHRLPSKAAADRSQPYPSKNAGFDGIERFTSTNAAAKGMHHFPSASPMTNGMQRSLPTVATVEVMHRYPSKNPVKTGMQLYPSNSVVNRMEPVPATGARVNGMQLYPSTAVNRAQPYLSTSAGANGMQLPPTSGAVVGMQRYPSASPIANGIQHYPSINTAVNRIQPYSSTNAAVNGMQPYLFTSGAANAIQGSPTLPLPGIYRIA